LRPVQQARAAFVELFAAAATAKSGGNPARSLARELGVPSNRITEIVAGGRAVSADTAIRLGERFATSAEFWLNLQMAHDLEEARRHLRRAA
jgi:addiction module HigA family antidote